MALVSPNLIWLPTGKLLRDCSECKDEFEQPEIAWEVDSTSDGHGQSNRALLRLMKSIEERIAEPPVERGPRANPEIISDVWK